MDTQQDRLVKRGVIIGMHQSGKSITEIAFEMEYVDIQFLNGSIEGRSR